MISSIMQMELLRHWYAETRTALVSKPTNLSQLRVGMSIGHHPDQGQFTPDMRKNSENVTLEERQEAKRRIEGSLAPESKSTGPADIK